MKKFLQAHNGISARLVDKSDYDGIWSSSLCDSASRGVPDTEILKEVRVQNISEMRMVANKPIMVDWDTGGDVRNFPYWLKRLEVAGANIIVIEDKAFPKNNSLGSGEQVLEDVDRFCEKISVGKKATKMKIFARIESLIAKKSIYNALVRADAYIDAGADGIVIHSKKEVSAKEVIDFEGEFRANYKNVPLVCIPTTYKLPEKHSFDYVIYANQLLRASVKAMKDYIDNKKTSLTTIEELFNLIK